MCKGVTVTLGTVQAGQAEGGPEHGRPIDAALRGTATTSPTGSIRRGLMAMALCWQVLVMGPDPEFWPTSHAGSWLLLPVTAAWMTWVLLLFAAFANRRWSQASPPWLKVADVVLLIVAGLGMIGQAVASGRLLEGFVAGASLVNLGVGLAGMLLPTVLARWLIGVAIGLEGLLFLAAWQAGSGTGRDALLYPLYAVAVGAGSQGARLALLRAAGQHEAALAEIRQARVRAAAVWSVRRELSRQERLIHERVLNTLAAIARGGLPQGAGAIRTAAAESAAVLQVTAQDIGARLMSATGHLPTDLGPLLDQLNSQGVDTRFVGSAAFEGDLRRTVSAEAYEGMLIGIREALANIQRHARARRAEVRVDQVVRRDQTGLLRVTVIDDGIGFDPVSRELRFGLTQSIDRTMLEVGGSALLVSQPGQGTSIELTVPFRSPERNRSWRRLEPAAESLGAVADESIPRGNAAFARPILAWFGAFVLLSALVTVGEEVRPLFTFASLALIAGLGSGLWFLSARSALPGWFVILAAVLAPVSYRLQMAAVDGPGLSHWQDWSSEALAVLWLVITAVGPWWTVLVALSSWLFTQGDPLHELLQPGTAIILAGALFARSVRRNGRAFAAAERQRTQEMSAVMAQAQVLDRIQARYELLGQSRGLTLLQAVAEGRLQPEDVQVQLDCGREERFIRSVMRLDPAADLVHRRAGQVALRARQLGLALDISLDDTEDWPSSTCERFFDEVERMIEVADPRSAARLTARLEGDALVMRFVASDGLQAIEVRHAGP